MIYTSFQPDLRIILRRAENGYADEDISGDVVMVSTTKAYGRAAGGFNIMTTFAPNLQGQRYDQGIRPDDVILISLDAGDGKGLHPVMVGLVDRVARVVSYDSFGKPNRRIKISGSDFGKLLVKHDCILDMQPLKNTETGAIIGGIGDQYAFRIQAGMVFAGTPREIVTGMFNVLFQQQLTLANYYVDKWFPDTEANEDTWKMKLESIVTTSGTVWQAMKGSANEPFNCLTTETYGEKLYVILEKYPFDKTTGKLTMAMAGDSNPSPPGIGTPNRGVIWPVDDRLVFSEDLGVSDVERINYLYLSSPFFMLFGAGDGSTPPIQWGAGIRNAPTSEIAEHGFMRWEPKTEFSPAQNEDTLQDLPHDAFGPIVTRTNELWTRVKDNHRLESGTITMHGAPWFKAGDGMLRQSENMEYFVEQVSHNFTIGERSSSFTTTLGLTRGQTHA